MKHIIFVMIKEVHSLSLSQSQVWVVTSGGEFADCTWLEAGLDSEESNWRSHHKRYWSIIFFPVPSIHWGAQHFCLNAILGCRRSDWDRHCCNCCWASCWWDCSCSFSQEMNSPPPTKQNPTPPWCAWQPSPSCIHVPKFPRAFVIVIFFSFSFQWSVRSGKISQTILL